MKRINLLTSLALAIGLLSCSKEMESTAENFYFKAKFNGTEKNFTTKSYATIYQVGGKQVLSILAGKGNETSSISLWTVDGAYKAGSCFGTGSPGCSNSNSFDYTSNQLSGREDASWGSVDLLDNSPEKFECKITEITSTYIRGTFTTDLYKRQSPVPLKMAVTDGEFYVRRQ